MKRSRLSLILGILLIMVMLVTVAACAKKPAATTSPAPAPTTAKPAPIAIRMPTSVPAGVAITDLRIAAATRFNAAVGGRYVMTVYPGGSMGTLEQTFDMARTGGTEMTEWPSEYVAGSQITFMAVSLPFAIQGFKSDVAYIHALNDALTGKIVEKAFNQKTISLICSDIHTPCSTKPIKTLADWKGKLVWVANPMEADGVAALGGTPVSMTFWDGYPSLQKGVIDTGMTSETSTFSFKWYDVIKYITLAYQYGTMIHTTMNLDFYNKLPADVQKALMDSYKWYEEQWVGAQLKEKADALAGLPKNGVEVYNLPADERAKWRATVQPVYDKYYQQIGPDAAKAVQAALDSVKSIAE